MIYLAWASVFALFIILLLGYFLGCLNGSVMVSHFVIKDDVRQHGSGNAGLTNFYRTYGARYALGVILFDMGERTDSDRGSGIAAGVAAHAVAHGDQTLTGE